MIAETTTSPTTSPTTLPADLASDAASQSLATPTTPTLPAALLLDMDDTILADSAGLREAWRLVYQRFADRVAPVSVAALAAAKDEYNDWYWSDPERHRLGRLDLTAARQTILAETLRRLGVFDDAGGDAAEMRAALAHEIAGAYAQLREETSHPLPGAIEALARLREQGMRLALITNGAAIPQRRKIERHQLASYFEVIIVEGEFGLGKPDPHVYQHALATLQLAPQQVWMVGDNLEWEVAAPQRLGIHGVWIDLVGSGLPANSAIRPDHIVGSLTELVATLGLA